MTDLTKKEQKALEKLEKDVNAKRDAWLVAYNTAKAKATPGTVVLGTGPETVLYEELVALRSQRNDLIAQFRAKGVNI